ncbi:MAG: hypothetical protein PHH08_05100 [Candidatus ainarchaeum sp.]|nr:hypothetical protein [Candidatus ainarchaeum sp.]
MANIISVIFLVKFPGRLRKGRFNPLNRRKGERRRHTENVLRGGTFSLREKGNLVFGNEKRGTNRDKRKK